MCLAHTINLLLQPRFINTMMFLTPGESAEYIGDY